MDQLLRNTIGKMLLEELEEEFLLQRLINPTTRRKKWKHRETEADWPKREDNLSPADAHRKIIKYLKKMRPSKKQELLIPGIKNALIQGRGDEMDYKNFLSPVVDHVWSTYKRVQIRKLWQLAVYSNRERSEFWRDPRNVSCIHGIGLFSEEDPLRIFRRILSSAPVELSCVGCLEPYIPGAYIGIEFLEREIVWACANDSWSQYIDSADDEVRKNFAALAVLDKLVDKQEFQVFKGGLAKYPSADYLNPNDVLFTEDDFLINGGGFIEEVIIRDYSVDPVNIIVWIAHHLGDEIPRLKKEIQKISFEIYNRPVTVMTY